MKPKSNQTKPHGFWHLPFHHFFPDMKKKAIKHSEKYFQACRIWEKFQCLSKRSKLNNGCGGRLMLYNNIWFSFTLHRGFRKGNFLTAMISERMAFVAQKTNLYSAKSSSLHLT